MEPGDWGGDMDVEESQEGLRGEENLECKQIKD